MERWKAVEGYEGLYEVSDMGNVKSLRNNIILVNVPTSRGYRQVTLANNGVLVTRFVHRLVGMAFCEGYSEELYINHKDGIRDNNVKSNLEWVTPQGNMDDKMRRGTHKINEASLRINRLRRERFVECMDRDGNPLAVFPTMAKAADSLGIPRGNIFEACNGVRKQAGGFKWRKLKR